MVRLSALTLGLTFGVFELSTADLEVKAFWWNPHWQCSAGAKGASRHCKDKAIARFVELAQSSQANIVGSIELEDSMSQSVHLPHHGLHGWTQVDGPCKMGHKGDAAALAFAPGWRVQDHFGGCLRHDSDTRAFAVARVTPPSPVHGCPELCVLTVHAPHQSIDWGKSMVHKVCGEAVNRCAIAMGDWNTPAWGVGKLWEQLIGGGSPSFIHPNERTCCYPEWKHKGTFDHLASNIPGMRLNSQDVMGYQFTHENPVEQHKPVAVSAHLPSWATANETSVADELAEAVNFTSIVV